MMNRMAGSVLTLITLLFSAGPVAAQNYTQMQWGMNKGVTPYQFGANINGTWSNLGTVSSAGVWQIPNSNIAGLGTAATRNIGVSGANVPLLNGVNTWSGAQNFSAGATIPFTQNGANAVPYTVDAKLKLIVNLQDFGGVGDNVTANDTAFNRAIAAVIAAGGGLIRVPKGKYVITSQINISDCWAPVFIEGDGQAVTTVRQTSATASGFFWDCGNNFNRGGGLASMTIEAGAGYDTARFTGVGSTGVGVGVNKLVGQGQFVDLSINNFSFPFSINGSWDNEIGPMRILYFDGVGLGVGTNTAIPSAGGSRIHNLKISNNGFTGDNTSSVGMQIGGTGGEYIHEIEITATHEGVVVAPGVGQQTAYLFMDKVAPDSTLSYAWVFNSTNGKIVSANCLDCWGAYATSYGFAAFGPAARYASVRFTNFRARENTLAGIYIGTTGTEPTDIEFVAAEVASNSRGNNLVHPGVSLASDVNGVRFVGGFIGNGGSAFSDQAYGIVCSGNNKISVIGTDLTKYGAGKSEYFCGAGNEITQYTRSAIIPGNVKFGSGVYSALPTCNAANDGTLAYITDSSTITFAATIAGGGANKVLALCDGANWTVH